MEFKGSEGKWRKVFSSENRRAIRNDGGLIATFWKPSKYSGQDERYESELKETAANQLLCSKAPEMLEMLSKVLTISRQRGVCFLPSDIDDEIENLIKKATTL